MARRLHHRGPDGQGVYSRGRVGLAHTRLAIIDLEGGAQPLHSADGTLALVANGEIYNHVELRQSLRARGATFATDSDCEVIVHLYALEGLKGLSRLRGMFAFALHDYRADRLILCRDRLGIKPLFVARQDGRVGFASEIKGLLPMLTRDPRVDPVGVTRFLEQEFHSGESTALREVSRVQPGGGLIIGPGNREQTFQYWSVADVEPNHLSEDEAIHAFDVLMSDVLREHERTDVPFGLFLSGGVDSAILASVLADRQPGRLQTFSVGFSDGGTHDELDDATRIATLAGTSHTALRLSSAELRERIPALAWSADELMRDYASLPTLCLAEEAARSLKVVFTGEGGDEVFAGYGRYRLHSPGRRLRAALDRRGGGLRHRSDWHEDTASAVLGAALRQASAYRRDGIAQAWSALPSRLGHVRRRQGVDMLTRLPDNLLAKVDRSLMAYGLEGRVPYLDHRIVEFGLALPDALKIRGRTGKFLLRRWAERHLPRDHLYRRKKGFTVDIGSLLDSEMLTALRDRLPRNTGVREWMRPEGVKALVDRQISKGDRATEVWGVLQFALWHRFVVEGQMPDHPPLGAAADYL